MQRGSSEEVETEVPTAISTFIVFVTKQKHPRGLEKDKPRRSWNEMLSTQSHRGRGEELPQGVSADKHCLHLNLPGFFDSPTQFVIIYHQRSYLKKTTTLLFPFLSLNLNKVPLTHSFFPSSSFNLEISHFRESIYL